MEYSNLFVCLMGMGTVFIGLISIIAMCKVISLVCNREDKTEIIKLNGDTTPIPNKQEIIAGISAVIAEELGTEITNIKVLSFKKI